MPTYRQERRFLENHLELLAPGALALLRRRLHVTRAGSRQAMQTAPEDHERQKLASYLTILSEIGKCGGTVEAIQQVYVGLYGGLTLDIPEWLEQNLAQLEDMPSGNSDEATLNRLSLLRSMMERARDDPHVTAVMFAQLLNRQADMLEEPIFVHNAAACEAAIAARHSALNVYTLARYRRQYAATQTYLGSAYRRRIEGEKGANLEQAIECFQAALQVYTSEDFPEESAIVHNNLGLTYHERLEGERRSNLECAIECYRKALKVITREASAAMWATIQYNLGNAYQARRDLEEAIACYEAALQVRTSVAFAQDYARVQHNLGLAYRDRLAGDRRANLERAITCFQEALRVYTRDAFPTEYAKAQVLLGDIYQHRIDGERRTNYEQAIARYNAALEIYTREAFPEEYANIQNSLGIAYENRLLWRKRHNIERAIEYYHAALEIYTPQAFPLYYARTQHNLGSAYGQRIEGERSANQEQAIAHFQAALEYVTRDEYPDEWASIQYNLGNIYHDRIAGDREANLEQSIACYEAALEAQPAGTLRYARCLNNLGNVYRDRVAGEREANLKQAVACYEAALHICTPDAFPADHHMMQLNQAAAEAERENWPGVVDAYRGAQAVEQVLARLGSGTAGRDSILKEGNSTGARLGFALTRCGLLEDAIVAIEQGRTRSLAEALALAAAEPALIKDERRRARYEEALETFRQVQALVNSPLETQFPSDAAHPVTEHELRRGLLEHAERYRKARQAFEEVVTEIQQAHDPADFLQESINAHVILEASTHCGEQHAIVYLVSTPWGGYAIAAFGANAEKNRPAHVDMLDLPKLTDIFVVELIESDLGDEETTVIGGFNCAQSGNGFAQIVDIWAGETFYEQAMTLREVCMTAGRTSMLDRAAQEVLQESGLAPLLHKPTEALRPGERRAIARPLGERFLAYELERCMDMLGEEVMRPLAHWLDEKRVASVTLIPCGWLAAFPLSTAQLAPGQTFADRFTTSVAPSARALARAKQDSTPRSGVYALGNAEARTKPLPWGEAEAFTLFHLARGMKLHAELKVQQQVTRDAVIQALQRGRMVDIACHGSFQLDSPLQSALTLAQGGQLTLGDVLSHSVNLRGLRLLVLSACQTAILDILGARDEVRSLAAGMLQAGAEAVLAALWPVDDRATYLLITRFAQEWLPGMEMEPPAAALVRAQKWLRSVTNRELQLWQAAPAGSKQKKAKFLTSRRFVDAFSAASAERGDRYEADEAESLVHIMANQQLSPDARPYENPIYWAGFQIIGW